MPPVVTRYLIPGAALLATFAVSLLLVFVVASTLQGGSDGDNAAASPPRTQAPPTATQSATRVPIAATPTVSVTPASVPTFEVQTPGSAAALATAEASSGAALPPPVSFAGTWRIVD